MSQEHNNSQESGSYFLGTMTQKERAENNPALEAVIGHSIATLFPAAILGQCLTSIKQGYEDPHRAFHDLQHIFQILPPIIQDKITRVQESMNAGNSSSRDEFTKEDKQIIVSTAYHDAKYHIDSKGVKDIITRLADKRKFTNASEPGKDGKPVNFRETTFDNIKIELKEQRFRELDISNLQELFGIQEDSKFTVGKMSSGLKLDGPPMNEFLSALTAVRDLAPGGIDGLNLQQKQNLFQTVIDIQMTVPFQPDHALHLFENAGKVKGAFGVSYDSNLIGMVNHAVDMSNRDIGNLLHKDFIHMLSGDYVIAAEFNGKSNSSLPITDLYNGVTNDGFAQFVMQPALDQNRLAQPRIQMDEKGQTSLITDSPEYLANKRNAQANINASVLGTKVMGAALTLLCVGQDETDRLCGHTGQNGGGIVDLDQKKHLMKAVNDSLSLDTSKQVIPGVLLDAMETVLERYSVSQLETLKKNGKGAVKATTVEDITKFPSPKSNDYAELTPDTLESITSTKVAGREGTRCMPVSSVCDVISGACSMLSNALSGLYNSLPGNKVAPEDYKKSDGENVDLTSSLSIKTRTSINSSERFR